MCQARRSGAETKPEGENPGLRRGYAASLPEAPSAYVGYCTYIPMYSTVLYLPKVPSRASGQLTMRLLVLIGSS